jgi:hypothetical protein
MNEPQEAPEQVTPDADHVTPAAPISFRTLAVRDSDCVTVRPPRFGEMVTLRAVFKVIVIEAEAIFKVFETEVAVRVTMAGFGAFKGAV